MSGQHCLKDCHLLPHDYLIAEISSNLCGCGGHDVDTNILDATISWVAPSIDYQFPNVFKPTKRLSEVIKVPAIPHHYGAPPPPPSALVWPWQRWWRRIHRQSSQFCRVLSPPVIVKPFTLHVGVAVVESHQSPLRHERIIAFCGHPATGRETSGTECVQQLVVQIQDVTLLHVVSTLGLKGIGMSLDHLPMIAKQSASYWTTHLGKVHEQYVVLVISKYGVIDLAYPYHNGSAALPDTSSWVGWPLFGLVHPDDIPRLITALQLVWVPEIRYGDEVGAMSIEVRPHPREVKARLGDRGRKMMWRVRLTIQLALRVGIDWNDLEPAYHNSRFVRIELCRYPALASEFLPHGGGHLTNGDSESVIATIKLVGGSLPWDGSELP
ncbi:hypothetical protein EV182_005875 [Spiromyces aspiralis]|uniref:Uncharacterized protein n=1 Tax=Spiromyces aspiralis TaxID=68401 RepID=A0ACC1HM10_9FUNG|nr:hypothetical protein EV182_005875 [Spiromyces aspiralis]